MDTEWTTYYIMVINMLSNCLNTFKMWSNIFTDSLPYCFASVLCVLAWSISSLLSMNAMSMMFVCEVYHCCSHLICLLLSPAACLFRYNGLSFVYLIYLLLIPLFAEPTRTTMHGKSRTNSPLSATNPMESPASVLGQYQSTPATLVLSAGEGARQS